jgi:hypothetical protein
MSTRFRFSAKQNLSDNFVVGSKCLRFGKNRLATTLQTASVSYDRQSSGLYANKLMFHQENICANLMMKTDPGGRSRQKGQICHLILWKRAKSWPRLSDQILRVAKWSLCRGYPNAKHQYRDAESGNLLWLFLLRTQPVSNGHDQWPALESYLT